MGELVKRGSKYSDEDRRNVVVNYALYGNQEKVSEIVNIPSSTISGWRNHSDWWDDLLAEVRNAKQDEHIAKYTQLVGDAIDYAHANLDKASPKDALIMAATATDKARLLLNQPTSISGKSSDMTALAKQFEELSKKWDEKQVNVVSVQQQPNIEDGTE